MTVEKRLTDGPLPKTKKQRTLFDFFGKEKKNMDSKEIISENIQTEKILKCMSSNDIRIKLEKLLNPIQLKLLTLELETIDPSWLSRLENEFKKPYFTSLKQFITNEQTKHTVFPPEKDIYSWSRLTPFNKVRIVIIGQDPYHNYNQAHGLAFSVKAPTVAPPSLKNIYKEIKDNNYHDFKIDNKFGDLTSWSKQGVLLLNTSLTVRAHCANSHSNKGWELFTKQVVQSLIDDRSVTKKPLVFLLWGNNAIKLIDSIVGSKKLDNFLILKSVHPSPLSASRGFFGNQHFKKINEWLYKHNVPMIDWSVVPNTYLTDVKKMNEELTKKCYDQSNNS